MFGFCLRTVAVILLSDFSSGKAALLSRGKYFQRTDDKKCPKAARRGSTHLPWVSNWLLTRWSRRRNAKHAVHIPQPPFGVLDIISALQRGPIVTAQLLNYRWRTIIVTAQHLFKALFATFFLLEAKTNDRNWNTFSAKFRRTQDCRV